MEIVLLVGLVVLALLPLAVIVADSHYTAARVAAAQAEAAAWQAALSPEQQQAHALAACILVAGDIPPAVPQS